MAFDETPNFEKDADFEPENSTSISIAWGQENLATWSVLPGDRAVATLEDRKMHTGDQWLVINTPHYPNSSPTSDHAQEWYIRCSVTGREMLSRCVDINLGVRGGIPVVKGTGFTVSQLLAEIADSEGLPEIAEDFDLDVETVTDILSGLSLVFGRPYVK